MFKNFTYWAVLPALLIVLSSACSLSYRKAQKSGIEQPRGNYDLSKGRISRNVLENYLSRSVTMAEFATGEGFYTDGPYPYKEDDIRMLKNTGAKFIGRSVYSWGSEQRFNDPSFWNKAADLIARMHAFDKEMIFQACIFEIITLKVNEVAVPAWVFKEFGLAAEKRNFDYAAMLNKEGKLVDHWSKGSSVPDISRLETRMWVYFLARNYLDIGVEAIHFGQVELIGMEDYKTGFSSWWSVLSRIRKYALAHARRGTVLCDAHVPHGGIEKDGKLLLDFHSFPLRPKAIVSEPQQTELRLDYMDVIYRKSKGGISPSGWKCESLPYLVEFDNYGISRQPGDPGQEWFVWGYDEISWYALQPEAYRNQWLRYAWNWVREQDPNGFVQMPGSRVVTGVPAEKGRRYRANTNSPHCPLGYGQEKVIKEIWEGRK
ncbi:hypothetical protein EDD80_104209 [Anseongella ginsenosidimutans]|uniref:Uncharacterized protein n=1 Tax=Anseongella ginsenosidimutans TaxID=496056 RepID=A0A4V2UTV7_9SPHI|nr:hypothetical protein [Anseongella ginsenosidimutans]TCS87858.1 hypothetical protein EDD80_104209 [Anseongella ginsenosidimutans]